MHLHVTVSYSEASRGGRDPLRGGNAHLMSELKFTDSLTQAFIAGSASAIQEKHEFPHTLFTFNCLSTHALHQQDIALTMSPAGVVCSHSF